MSKKKIIFISVIVILVVISGLYAMYAINVFMEEGTPTTYDMTINFELAGSVNREMTVEAGKTKVFDIDIKNPYDDKVQYGVAYSMVSPTTLPSDVTVAESSLSKNSAVGLIDAYSTISVSIVIANDSSESVTISFSIINGYKNGGDLIVPSGKTLINDVYGIPQSYEKIDNSGANLPGYIEGLIPVVYNESTSKWVKADINSSTSTYGWYDYDTKKWANAVLVTDTNRNAYKIAEAGTTINDSDILAFYVWIPRYKYKVCNITKTEGIYSYDAQTTGIDIEFESEKSTTGTVSCNYDFTVTDGSLSEICTGSNGDYYTHSAFTFGNKELTGFWIGKFEVSNSSGINVLPNVSSMRYTTLGNFYSAIKNMQASNNVYGLTTDTSKVDSHMLKNMKWGAVAYLTNSKYGRCTYGTCTEVAINSYNDYTTGCGPQSQGSTSSGSTCNAYNTELGMTSSTTGNIYGVYDMSGGALEYVMGNISYDSGSYTYNDWSAGGDYSYTSETAKYLNEYAYGTSDSDQAAYNRARLGDATGEIVSYDGYGWYGDDAYFPIQSYPWFKRSGLFSASDSAGLFYFCGNAGSGNFQINGMYSSRSALIVY